MFSKYSVSFIQFFAPSLNFAITGSHCRAGHQRAIHDGISCSATAHTPRALKLTSSLRGPHSCTRRNSLWSIANWSAALKSCPKPKALPRTGPVVRGGGLASLDLANFSHLSKEPCPGPARHAVVPFFLRQFLFINQGILEHEFITLGTFSQKAPACTTCSKIKIFCVPTPKTLYIAIPATVVC